MKILGTGLSGLVGSRIVELLNDWYTFDSEFVDVTDLDAITQKIKSSDASLVIHLAAKTNVDGCELDKSLGESGEAWRVNVLGTKNIVDVCKESKKKLIYISTDFVFDGSKELYSEEDIPRPINWYSQTKYEGEKIVQKTSIPWIIARIAYPYRSNFVRNDFLRTILIRLQKNEQILGVTDHIFTPTFIDDIANAIDTLIKNNAQGIFHVVGSQSLTPYDSAKLIAETYGFDLKTIIKTTRAEFFKGRAPRPFHLALKNDKIEKLGIKMRTFEEGLKELKFQMSNLKSTSQI